MIDSEQNILYKGKVARLVSSVDCILLTQLVFSAHIKSLTDEELLALISCLVSNVRAAKSHPMLESEISSNFW